MILRIKLRKKIKILEAEYRDLLRTDLDNMLSSEKIKHYIEEQKLTYTIKILKSL